MNIIKHLLIAIVAAWLPLAASAQDGGELTVSAVATYVDSLGVLKEVTSIDNGEAPLEVTFIPQVANLGNRTPAYEWHFARTGEEGELMVRYEEQTTYRFMESGNYSVTLRVTFAGDDTEYLASPITITILDSKLEFPNGISPNRDGYNDELKPKEGYRSIVEFHAYIFNRWGQKLYEWTDVNGSWDGTYKGKVVKDGVYYLLVKAKGADGHVYNLRQDVNVLTGHTNDDGSSTTGATP